MDPRHDPDLILGHLEGDLTSEDDAKVQALRAADPDFAQLLDDMAQDRSRLRAAPAAEPPAGLTDGVLADLERSMLLDGDDNGIAMLPPGRRRFTLAPLLTYGGIAAVLALTATAVLKSVQQPAPSPPIAAAPAADGFDIAAAPIQAQRDLARRDRAHVGFSANETTDRAIVATTDSAPDLAVAARRLGANAAEKRVAGQPLGRTTDDAATPAQAAAESIVLDAPAALTSAPDPRAEQAAESNNAFAGAFSDALAAPTTATAAMTIGDIALDIGPQDDDLADNVRGATIGPTPAPDEAVAASASTTPTPSLAPAASDAAPAPQVTVPVPASATWQTPIEHLGSDWTRWTTLPAASLGRKPLTLP